MTTMILKGPGRTHKRCPRCEQTKPVDQFSRRVLPSGRMGVHSYCKPCNSANNRLWRIGLTQEQYDQMVADQDGLCAICDEPPTADDNPRTSVLHIDHDHATGKVRQLLCWRCNCGLGNFADDIDRMAAALAYLVKHGGQ